MASPKPPVPLENHCAIIYDEVLYVYSPTAFLTLPLKDNATWTQEQNGVAVTGGLCVKGGVDGDSNNPALYIVGGSTNSSTSNYSGIQRYSIRQKKWDTIWPISAVTANRLNHGATYLNASSAILIYGGSQNGNPGPSTETFLMLMYPPYRVQSYPSVAPPAVKPVLLPWSDDKAVMVGGGDGQNKVFTFHPDPGWVDINLSLPMTLPDPSVAQNRLQILDDGTKVLQTFYTNQSPNLVTRNVLQNAGYQPASYGETIGDPTSNNNAPNPPPQRLRERQVYQFNYPPYNASAAPNDTRTGFALAYGNGDSIALVGGDKNNSVAVFDGTKNSWVDTTAVFGEIQKPLTASSSSTLMSSPTSTHNAAAPTTSAAAPGGTESQQTNGLAILGGVLGGVAGFAAILIIILLWLRQKRRRKASEARRTQQMLYPEDKPRTTTSFDTRDGGDSFDDNGLQPLSKAAQPMGRSPVPSAAISEPDSIAMFGGRFNDKHFEASAAPGSRLNPNAPPPPIPHSKSKREKPSLVISRPMNVDLGDYKDRPSIDLGRATPATTSTAPVLPPVAVVTDRKMDQRKTDEGWAKYFQEEKDSAGSPTLTVDSTYPQRPSTAKSSRGGFWPGSGVPESFATSKPPSKLALRDSGGQLLNQQSVLASSPSLQDPSHTTRNLTALPPIQPKISSADSISSDDGSDDGYEDDRVSAYSSGIPDRAPTWTPVGNTWSGPPQRPLRPPSVRVGATDFPPPTSQSNETSNTSASNNSSIPVFPMPNATIRRVGPSGEFDHTGTTTVENPYAPGGHYRRPSSNYHGGSPVPDYFGPPHHGAAPSVASTSRGTSKLPDSTDMSWLNLGTPNQRPPLPNGPHAYGQGVDGGGPGGQA